MLDKENYNSHGVEPETFEDYSDGDLIDKYYELQRTAKADPVHQEEYENAEREVVERGIIAKRYTHDDLFKEANTDKPDLDWANGLSDSDEEDETIFNTFYNEAMKKQSESQPDKEIRKIPEDVLSEAYNRLKDQEEKGILSHEDEADLTEVEMELNRRKMASKDIIPGGLAEGKDSDEFDRGQLKAGIEVEMEHTDNQQIAEEIAKDHLTEDRNYYKKLKTIESICDTLEENRYYYSTPEDIISKTAKKLNQDINFVSQLFYDRYIR